MIFSYFKKWRILSAHTHVEVSMRTPKEPREVQERQSMSGKYCIFYFESASTFISCTPPGNHRQDRVFDVVRRPQNLESDDLSPSLSSAKSDWAKNEPETSHLRNGSFKTCLTVTLRVSLHNKYKIFCDFNIIKLSNNCLLWWAS